uniref:Uncharacterized protein n=1 Tax=Moschus moschiferus TaxID=68415 RepID=A0A8C6D701_MOSMO
MPSLSFYWPNLPKRLLGRQLLTLKLPRGPSLTAKSQKLPSVPSPPTALPSPPRRSQPTTSPTRATASEAREAPDGCVSKTSLKESNLGTCPVAQWLRICLAMQGTQV